jgi:hypothetical protein
MKEVNNMKKITFQGREYFVLDETGTHYVCEPMNRNEGYHYISKDKVSK